MNDWITIALPKGRLAEDTLNLLVEKNIAEKNCIDFKSRKLIFIDEKNKLKFLLIRNMDVPVYVEYGACDLGVVGKDIIEEVKPNIYEFIDLGFGYCRMCVCGIKGKKVDLKHDITVATKFVNITKNYFAKKGILIETIKLYGSIEIAPILGLSDLIVDIVSTGETLRKNGLEEIETMMESTAKLIGNKNLSKCKFERIKNIVNTLETS
jgi:ATP phosphoribosyltransferase